MILQDNLRYSPGMAHQRTEGLATGTSNLSPESSIEMPAVIHPLAGMVPEPGTDGPGLAPQATDGEVDFDDLTLPVPKLT